MCRSRLKSDFQNLIIKSEDGLAEDGHIYCILLIRIAFCHVSENLQLHCLFYVTMNIYF